jgi:hypothetical protein
MYWFLRQKIKLGIPLAGLTCLAYFTSIQFFGSALWWASVGTQHLLSQFLTIYLLSSVTDFFHNNFSQNALNRVVFRGLLLALSSEIFIPVFVVFPILMIFLKEFLARKDACKEKNKFFKKSIRGRFFQFILPSSFSFLTTLSVFFLFRYFVIDLDKVVAASSAKNFDFKSFDLSSIIFQNLNYLASFSGNIFGVDFYDYGANEYRLRSFSDYGLQLRIFSITVAGLGAVLFFWKFTSTRIWKLKDFGKEQGLYISFLLVLVLCVFVPSLVPEYQQIRWVQLPYLLFLLLLTKIGGSDNERRSLDRVLGIFLVLHVPTNLLLIQDNFGVKVF